jgi:hypothetical protein
MVLAQIDAWCDDSHQLVDLACSLAPGDERVIRDQLTPFMASLNYRVAARLRGSLWRRLAAYIEVGRSFGTPPRGEHLKALVARTPWFMAATRIKHGLQSLHGARAD